MDWWKIIQYAVIMYPVGCWLERSIDSSIESACAAGAAAWIIWWVVSLPDVIMAILSRNCNCACGNNWNSNE